MRVRIRDVVAPVFWPVHRAIARGTVQELVAKGGRGSGKSSYISIELVLQLLRHPACHAVVLRKIGGTLRTSVYAQIQWAIGALGLAKQFRCTVSPMECTYLPTAEDPLFWHRRPRQAEKHQGAIWSHRPGLVRELDQFDGPEEVRSVEQSVFRGGSFTLASKASTRRHRGAAGPTVMRWNSAPASWCTTPPTATCRPPGWANAFWRMPPTWNRPTPRRSAMNIWAKRSLRHGSVWQYPAANLTTEQCRSFDRLYHGVDWGWYPDLGLQRCALRCRPPHPGDL